MTTKHQHGENPKKTTSLSVSNTKPVGNRRLSPLRDMCFSHIGSKANDNILLNYKRPFGAKICLLEKELPFFKYDNTKYRILQICELMKPQNIIRHATK